MHEPILEPVLSRLSITLSLFSLFITRIIPLSIKAQLIVAIDFALTLLAQYLVSFDDFSIFFLLHFHFLIVQIQKIIFSFPFF